MKTLKYTAIFLGMVALTIGLSYLVTGQKQASDEIAQYCQIDAQKAQKTFKGTHDEGFNFYQSCIENITKTSPITRENKLDQLTGRDTTHL